MNRFRNIIATILITINQWLILISIKNNQTLLSASASSSRCEVIKWKFLIRLTWIFSNDLSEFDTSNLHMEFAIRTDKQPRNSLPTLRMNPILSWKFNLKCLNSQSLIFRFLTQICWCTTYTLFQRTTQKGYNWKIACKRTLLDHYYHYHYCLICLPRPLTVIKLKLLCLNFVFY